MVAKGHRTHIGAHGEPPLGVNYHAEMMFTKAGGLTNYEVRFIIPSTHLFADWSTW